MKATEILNQIKEVLGLELAEEVKLEIQKLENGTSLEAASFEPSQEIFIVGEDGSKIALPVGEDYKLEDGRTITVEKVEDLELTAQVVEPIAHNPEAKSEANNNIGHNVSSNLSALREMIYNN